MVTIIRPNVTEYNHRGAERTEDHEEMLDSYDQRANIVIIARNRTSQLSLEGFNRHS